MIPCSSKCTLRASSSFEIKSNLSSIPSIEPTWLLYWKKFGDMVIPQILWKLIFADTGINDKKKINDITKDGNVIKRLKLHFYCKNYTLFQKSFCRNLFLRIVQKTIFRGSLILWMTSIFRKAAKISSIKVPFLSPQHVSLCL